MTRAIVFLTLIYFVLGCAYLSHSRRKPVFIDTAPSGYDIEVDGKRHTTPVTLYLKRKDNHTVVGFGADGKTTTRKILAERNSKWNLGHVFWLPVAWNVPGLISDTDKAPMPLHLMVPVVQAAFRPVAN
jgi:hypothetical protein